MTEEFKEYPKALYKDGLSEDECVIVESADQETEQNAKGFYAYGTAPEKTAEDGDQLAALRETAASKGIAVDGRWSIKRLEEEIAKVEAV